jgi:putative transposase
LKDLDRAFKDAFDKAQPLKRLPVFKRKFKCVDSMRFPQGVRISNNAVFLPKIGWVGFKLTRSVLGTIKNTTVKREGDRWKVVFQTERSVEEPVHPNPTSSIGVDRGCKFLAVTSDGEFVAGPKAFSTSMEKLVKLQRSLATKVKFSLRWYALKKAIGALHRRISSIRKDFRHKLSSRWAKNHGLIILEDLRIVGMTASAKGSIEEPGVGVARKSGLNRSILDQGWGELARQLGYKLSWLGGLLLVVPPHFSSQECPDPDCGCRESGL